MSYVKMLTYVQTKVQNIYMYNVNIVMSQVAMYDLQQKLIKMTDVYLYIHRLFCVMFDNQMSL